MTEQTKTVTVDVGALAMLRDFAKKTHAAQVAGLKASNILIRAAIKSAAHFEDTAKAFYAEIRADVNGLATAIGAERNKSGDGFVVPNTIMAQVSQVLRAIKNGVNLGTDSDPISPTEMRKQTAEKIEAASKAAVAAVPLTGDAAIRAPVLKALADMEAAIKAATGETLNALVAIVVVMAADATKVLRDAEQAKADAAKPEGKAEAIAQVAAEAAPVANSGMLPNGKAAKRTTRKAA